jgi:hypothetical protein
MKIYENKPKYIQLFLGDFGNEVWDLPYTHTFYPSSFSKDKLDDAFEEIFSNGYELICLDSYQSRYIFKKIC